jgi:hypothetical protein
VCGDPDFIREVGGPDLARRLNLPSTESEILDPKRRCLRGQAISVGTFTTSAPVALRLLDALGEQ